MRFLDNEQREQIGFSFIMDELAVITPYGSLEKKNIRPYSAGEFDLLIEELNNVEIIIKFMVSYKDKFNCIVRVLHKFKDIRNSLKRAKELEVLDEIELYEIKNIALNMQVIKENLELMQLPIKKVQLLDLSKLVELLDPGHKKMSTFYIYEEYSDKLRDIRQLKREKEKAIFGCKDDNELENLKSERLDLVIEEENEELIIRKSLTEKIGNYIENINCNLDAIGILDLLMAKGTLANKYNCVKPDISKEMNIELIDMVNPEIENILNKKGKKFSPVTIELKSGTTVITGANMGGKSVALKTIVLNLFLGQLGFFVFGKKATYPILDFIYFISDDMQSISKGLSTFGAEIIKLKEVIESTKRGVGFIALDEFARGTNPKEGYYLVKSLANYLQRFSTVTLISTHYDGVVEDPMVHYQVVGLKNIDLSKLKYKINLNKTHSVEIIQEHMEYKLEPVGRDNEVPKDALNIAMLLGLESDIVDIAKTYYEEEYHGK